MTVAELIERLKEFEPSLEVGVKVLGVNFCEILGCKQGNVLKAVDVIVDEFDDDLENEETKLVVLINIDE